MAKTNRHKYFLQRDEYDIMAAISNNTSACAIDVVGGSMRDEHGVLRCKKYKICEKCIQKWLNEEVVP